MSESGRSPLRSAHWFAARDLAGFIHRSSLHSEGISREALAGRPVIGICNSWSELVNCNLHFRRLAESVKRGVLMAGGRSRSARIRSTRWCCWAAATRRCPPS